MQIITLANFRSCGKSSIARILAEKLNSSILNFDTERDSEHYNVVHTINISRDKKISRTDKTLILSDNTAEQIISSKSGYLICDLGGYYDERLAEIQSDVYIIPTFQDYESMRETVRTAHFILKSNHKANIIFILNGAMIRDKSGKQKFIDTFNEMLEINGLNRFKCFYLSYSNLMNKIVDEAVKKEDVKTKNGVKISYKNLDQEINEILNFIKGAI